MPHDPFPDVPEPDVAGLFRARVGGRRAYEDAAVRRVCTKIGLPRLAPRIAAESESRVGEAGCLFAIFEEMTHFPIRFRVGRLRNIRFLALSDLFNKFARTPIGRALADLAADVDPADGPIGLVFRWSGAPDEGGVQKTIKGGTFMAAHTDGSATTAGSTRITTTTPLGTDPAAFVIVETLDSLLLAYSNWTHVH
jgi:hypothetical protein